MSTKGKARRKVDLLKLLRNPARLKRELQEFRQSAQVLSSDHPRLITKYPDKWVAVYHGIVAVHGPTRDAVLKKMKRENIPQEQTIVRYIEKNRRTMILRGLCSGADSEIRPGVRISKQ